MKPIATQAYIKIERKITSTEQINIEHDRMIYLYEDRVVTEHRTFPIKEVMDVSYRVNNKENKIGLLYLHTMRGLFAYSVKGSVAEFIKHLRQVI